MDFGCVFFANPEAYKDAALAEKLGFTHSWLYDSQMLGSDVNICGYPLWRACAVNDHVSHAVYCSYVES